MNYQKNICSECEEENFIVNKFYNLCDSCNKGRLASNKTEEKRKPINRSKPNTKYSALIRNLATIRENICTGCGKGSELTNSHLIPRSKRPDLTLNQLNITYHCMSCHNTWEHGSLEKKSKMLDFTRNMEIIKQLDIKYYNRINERV